MKALVTGATGFVGKYLVQELCDLGVGVRALVRSNSERKTELNNAAIELWPGDLLRPKTLEGIGQGINIVYHLAAMGHVSAISEEAYRQFFEVNVHGTENLMLAVSTGNIEKFIHFSSTAAMGLIRKKRVDEKDAPQPSTPYQKSKLQSEATALLLANELNIPTVILRPCMIYGPGGYGEFHKMAVLMRKGRFPKVGRGLNLTPLVHVQDVTQAARMAAERGRPGEVYLIASDKSLPMDEMRDMIMAAWDMKVFYPYVPAWTMYALAWGFEALSRLTNKAPLATRRNIANTVWDREFSIDKSRRELGYTPQIPFERGIHQTVTWFKEQGK